MASMEDLSKYIVKEGIGGPDFPVLDVPVVDIALLTSSSQNELDKLRLAFISCGCIQAVNHGVEESFLEEVHSVSKEFYSLPMEDKLKCAMPKHDQLDGYGNDSDKQTLDWNSRLYLNVQPLKLRKLNVWPQNPKHFRKLLVELTEKLEKVNEEIVRGMAKSLKLKDSDSFLKQFGERAIVASRFNFYPPCSRPDAVLAARPHGDASAVTYLLQDKNVEGLQVLKDGQWYRVPIIPPNAILINIGDQMEIMSNGMFKSPIHRVVTNPDKERITIAIFFSPEPTNKIGPVEALIDETNPRLFKSVVDYTDTYIQSFQTGRRPIDLLRL